MTIKGASWASARVLKNFDILVTKLYLVSVVIFLQVVNHGW